MKIAVTYENGKVFQHFGKTETFKVYEVEDGKVISSEVIGSNGEGHGALAGVLEGQGVDVLICGGLGGGAQAALAEAGIEVCSGAEGDADQAVEAYLKGKTTVVAGPSGVGKSAITNRMQNEIQMATGESSKTLKIGKHTTRHSQMIPIDHETYLCDTPGFSSLYTTDMEKEELKNFFPEIHAYLVKCRFVGCIHGKDPGCAVKEGLEQGNISKERFENYTMFYEELKEQEKRRY